MRSPRLLGCLSGFLFCLHALTAAPIPVARTIHIDQPLGAVEPLWRLFGYDEPKGLVTGGAFHPPADHAKWGARIEAWARHAIERYGQPGPAAELRLVIDGLPAELPTVRLAQTRVDDDHGNAYTAWQTLLRRCYREPATKRRDSMLLAICASVGGQIEPLRA